MTTLLGILAILTLLAGFLSALYWYKSSKVMIIPMEEINGELNPLSIAGNQTEWLEAVYLGVEKTGALNKKAAIFTATAVSLSAISSFVSIVLSNAA